ncbi:hypothetical protein EG327_004976, partial [Venturia inaequalis]
ENSEGFEGPQDYQDDPGDHRSQGVFYTDRHYNRNRGSGFRPRGRTRGFVQRGRSTFRGRGRGYPNSNSFGRNQLL